MRPFWRRTLAPQPAPKGIGTNISGRFFARVWDIECVLEWQLDEAGHAFGFFGADGDRLGITGEVSASDSLVRGAIRAHDMGEAFATFLARPDLDDLLLELRAGDAEPEYVLFARLG